MVGLKSGLYTLVIHEDLNFLHISLYVGGLATDNGMLLELMAPTQHLTLPHRRTGCRRTSKLR